MVKPDGADSILLRFLNLVRYPIFLKLQKLLCWIHIPENPTHPDIQPHLFRKTLEFLNNNFETFTLMLPLRHSLRLYALMPLRPVAFTPLAFLNIFKCHLLKPFFFKQPGNSFYNGSSYLKVNRQIWILMGNIDPGSDNKMNLITFH